MKGNNGTLWLPHVHTRFSDRYVSPTLEKVIDMCLRYQQNNSDKNLMLCITDSNHAEYIPYLLDNKNKLQNKYGWKIDDLDNIAFVIEDDCNKMYLLNGIEGHTKKGHLLVEGFDINNRKNIESVFHNKTLNFEDQIKRIKESDGDNLIILPHPFNVNVGGAIKNKNIEKIVLDFYNKGYIDAVEEFNAINQPFFKNSNEQTKYFCTKYGVRGIYSSDSHHSSQIFLAYTLLKNIDFSNRGKLLSSIRDSLRNYDYQNEGDGASKFNFIYTMLLRRVLSPCDIITLVGLGIKATYNTIKNE